MVILKKVGPEMLNSRKLRYVARTVTMTAGAMKCYHKLNLILFHSFHYFTWRQPILTNRLNNIHWIAIQPQEPWLGEMVLLYCSSGQQIKLFTIPARFYTLKKLMLIKELNLNYILWFRYVVTPRGQTTPRSTSTILHPIIGAKGRKSCSRGQYR